MDKEIAFGSCLFIFTAEDNALRLCTRDIQGNEHTHVFPLSGAFLVNIGGSYWRLVTGAEADSVARHLFEDVGVGVENRVSALKDLGVPILDREEGKQNLDHYKLPVKRLMLTT